MEASAQEEPRIVTAAAIQGLQRETELGLLRLDPVPAEALDWPLTLCLPHLAVAIAKTEEITVPQVIDSLYRNEATLVVEMLDDVPQGCLISTVVEYPALRAGLVVAIAGLPGKLNRYPNRDSFELISAWFRLLGCDCIDGDVSAAGARLWQRVGFTEVSRKVRMKL